MTGVTQCEVLPYFVDFSLFLALCIRHLLSPVEFFLSDASFPSLHSLVSSLTQVSLPLTGRTPNDACSLQNENHM